MEASVVKFHVHTEMVCDKIVCIRNTNSSIFFGQNVNYDSLTNSILKRRFTCPELQACRSSYKHYMSCPTLALPTLMQTAVMRSYHVVQLAGYK
jgi:hypothetical protein